MAGEPERESEWLGALVALRAFAAVGAVGVCLLTLPALPADGQTRAVASILAINLLLAVPSAMLAVFQARVRPWIQIGLLTAQGIAWLGTLVVLSARESDVTVFAWAMVVVAMVFASLHVVVVLRYASVALRAGRRLWRSLVNISAPMAIGGLLVTGYYRLDAVFVVNIAGEAEAGIYGAAYRLLDTVHFLPAAVMMAVFPAISAIHGSDPERVRRLVQAASRYIAIIAIGMLAGTVALADPFIASFFGPEYSRSAAVLPVLMLAFVFISQGYIAGWLVPLLGRQWLYARCAAGGLVLNIGLNLLLIPSHGALGAAWATVCTEFAVNAATLTVVFRALAIRPPGTELLRVGVAGFVLAACGHMAARLGLAPGFVVAAVAYALALIALRVVGRDDLAVLRPRPAAS
jgi:O-antigen/teichoic acid export membrane protein